MNNDIDFSFDDFNLDDIKEAIKMDDAPVEDISDFSEEPAAEEQPYAKSHEKPANKRRSLRKGSKKTAENETSFDNNFEEAAENKLPYEKITEEAIVKEPIPEKSEEVNADIPEEAAPAENIGKPKKKIVAKILLILLETLLLVLVALYGLMAVLTKGPSSTAKKLFVKSVRESSAVGFLADIYLSPEEIAEIEASTGEDEVIEMDTSLINIVSTDIGTEPDAWGLVDEDGDGIIIEPVKGSSYSGYMMVVRDPSRVIMGAVPENINMRGYTVEQMVQHFGAVAGSNGGGFQDPNGQGNGSAPDSTIVFEGEMYCGTGGTHNGFVGIDDKYILHVDCQDTMSILDANIQYGCAYGPILIRDGEVVVENDTTSGLNPRTAIGQRSDGAILILVIDGRHVVSLGATYMDEAEIMLRYGAVNAGNMDGGSSSLLYFNNEYVNNKAFVIGVRPVPSTWLVMPAGGKYYGEE